MNQIAASDIDTVLFLLFVVFHELYHGGSGSQNEEDQRALSLLNKFIGAQILVQCAEPMVIGAGDADDASRQTKLERDASTSTLQTSQSEHISPDGKVRCIQHLN